MQAEAEAEAEGVVVDHVKEREQRQAADEAARALTHAADREQRLRARAAWQQSAAVGGVQPKAKATATNTAGAGADAPRAENADTATNSGAGAEPASAAKTGKFKFRRKGHHKRLLAKEALAEVAATGVPVPASDSAISGFSTSNAAAPTEIGGGRGGVRSGGGVSGGDGAPPLCPLVANGPPELGPGLSRPSKVSAADVLNELLQDMGGRRRQKQSPGFGSVPSPPTPGSGSVAGAGAGAGAGAEDGINSSSAGSLGLLAEGTCTRWTR